MSKPLQTQIASKATSGDASFDAAFDKFIPQKKIKAPQDSLSNSENIFEDLIPGFVAGKEIVCLRQSTYIDLNLPVDLIKSEQ